MSTVGKPSPMPMPIAIWSERLNDADDSEESEFPSPCPSLGPPDEGCPDFDVVLGLLLSPDDSEEGPPLFD